MNALSVEIRNQLLTINDEQIKAIKDLKESVSSRLGDKAEQTVETYRSEIYAAYQVYFKSQKGLPIICTETIMPRHPDFSSMENYLNLEEILSKITEKLGYQIQALLQVQSEGCIERLEKLCREYDAMKEQTAAGFGQSVKTVPAPRASDAFDNKSMGISEMGVSLSGGFWLRNIFNGDYSLSKRLWNIFTHNKEADINLAAEKTISFLKETFSKQISESMESIFTPLLDSLTEQSKKIITNDY